MKEYKIIESKNNTRPYAVFTNCGGFWQQVSNWYFYKGNAIKKLNQLTNK